MTTAIIPGSLAAVAKQEGQSLAESFMSADAIVLIDVSGSMDARDVDGRGRGRSRFEAACDELARLQRDLPGKIAVVQFSTSVQFCWGGKPLFKGAGTNLLEALRFVQPADGTVEFFVISDGGPAQPDDCLSLARRFDSTIHAIFIGPESDTAGAAFMRKLASVSGGQSSVNKVPELAARVAGLLASGKAA